MTGGDVRARGASIRAPYPSGKLLTRARFHMFCRPRPSKGFPMRSSLLRDAFVLRSCLTTFCLTLLASCSHAPPPDFAPDPGLVSQIRDIRIVTGYTRACPGAVIPTSYEAVLADGARVPFARSYDKKHPPRLHVVFLDRESPDAVSQE